MNDLFEIEQGVLKKYKGKKSVVIIPNDVTAIGEFAFCGCKGLTNVTIGDSVTSIGNSAFSRCSGLRSIEIPNSVTTIGNYAFYDCTGLTSVTIGDSVTTIGVEAFYGCTSLTIYCEAKSKPSGWDVYWNSSNCPVVWGHKGVNSQRARPTK